MVDRIVVTLDGSPFAEAAVPYAAAVAKASGAKVEGLRVAHAGEMFDAEAYAQETEQRLGVPVRVGPTDGLPAVAILKELRDARSTIVAMATHGRGGLVETVMGSVASQVLQEAACPLLLVRPSDGDGAEPWSLRTVVIALDGSDYSERVIEPAGELAKAAGAGVRLVQAISPEAAREGVRSGDVVESSYVRSRAERIRESQGVEVDWDVLHGDPADAISDNVRGEEGAMLAMASHARKPLNKVLMGSVTSACLRRAGVPMLVVGPNFAP